MNIETRAIRTLEERYGLVLFRMALTHLVDVGHRNLGEDEVKECVKQIMAQAEESEKHGKIQIMTSDFQCEIVRCAAGLAQFSIWTLFAYIKNYVDISN